MQKDFYGDDSEQRLIANDWEQIPEANITQSMFQDLDANADLAESFDKIQMDQMVQEKLQQKAQPGMAGAPRPPQSRPESDISTPSSAASSVGSNAQREAQGDQQKKSSKLLQKKLNLAEKKLAQKMPRFKDLNARYKNNEDLCHRLIQEQIKSDEDVKSTAEEIFEQSYQYFLQAIRSNDAAPGSTDYESQHEQQQ